jgi:hypothetical protein
MPKLKRTFIAFKIAIDGTTIIGIMPIIALTKSAIVNNKAL